MSSPLKEVTIYCDGSSLGNGSGPGGTRAAAVALLTMRGVWRAVGLFLGEATNQQAEITAATLGLEALREPCRVLLMTDSRYVVETMEGRFRRRSNHEWWAKLDRAARVHRIEWKWIRGHAGQPAQEAADQAARRIATLGRVCEDVLESAISHLSPSGG